MIRKPSPLAFAVALALAAPVTHAQENSARTRKRSTP